MGCIYTYNNKSYTEDEILKYIESNIEKIGEKLDIKKNDIQVYLHEFSHPFLQWMRDNKPAHYQAGVKLLESNSTEAQPYIDQVRRTQPGLREGSQEFQEEVLAQIVGDQGAQLVNSAKSGSIREWLENFWKLLQDIVGITQYTPTQISKMKLSEFAQAVNAEMLDRKAVQNSSLSLAALEQPLFKIMRGTRISPQAIRNGMKGKGIKKIESDIANSVLDMPEFQTKKIDYDTFELAVKAQLMPLTPILSNSYSYYGSSEIDGDYDKTETIIYNSPLEHGITGDHFKSDYNPQTLDQLEYPTKPTIEDFKYIDEDSGETVISIPGQGQFPIESVTEQELREKLENFYQSQIERYNELLITLPISQPNQGLFGHTRVWSKGNIYNVAEVQSDVFQSDYSLLQNNIEIEEIDKKFDQDLKKLKMESGIQQFEASEKFFELRLIRESIQNAANRGFEKLRLPLPYTLSKIEGYIKNKKVVQTDDYTLGATTLYLDELYYIIKIDENLAGEITPFYNIEMFPKDSPDANKYKKEIDDNDKSVRNIMETNSSTNFIEIVNKIKEADLKEPTYKEYFESNNIVYFIKNPDIFENVSFKEYNVDATSFKIEELPIKYQTIARRYEEFGQMLEKERGSDNYRIIEDKNGYPWYETDIKPEDKINPVLAFQAEREAIDELIRTGYAIGRIGNTEKVARERFNIPKLKKISSGSDRIVYELDDTRVLKIAKTARGLQQNYSEGDIYLVREGILPEVYEEGLNYVVVEKVVPIKAQDIVPTYDVEGEQIGTEKANKMLADLSKFSQRDFETHSQKMIDILYKYGMFEVINYDILMGDFGRKMNWGMKDGKPIHLDGGTFAGIRLLTDYQGKTNLEDADFREVYQRSREVKKAYGDRDSNTMFQVEAQQTEMIPSILFEQLRQQPFITSEQALEAYKNIYTDSVGDWQSSEMNC